MSKVAQQRRAEATAALIIGGVLIAGLLFMAYELLHAIATRGT